VVSSAQITIFFVVQIKCVVQKNWASSMQCRRYGKKGEYRKCT